MKARLGLVFGFLIASLSMGSEIQKPDLSGKWVVESLKRDGKADNSLKGATRIHDGDKYTIEPAANTKAQKVVGTFKIDADKSPMHYDMKPTSGRYKDQTLQGIMKLEGDTLTICFAEPGKPRPTSFESKEGSGVVLVVHKKAK